MSVHQDEEAVVVGDAKQPRQRRRHPFGRPSPTKKTKWTSNDMNDDSNIAEGKDSDDFSSSSTSSRRDGWICSNNNSTDVPSSSSSSVMLMQQQQQHDDRLVGWIQQQSGCGGGGRSMHQLVRHCLLRELARAGGGSCVLHYHDDDGPATKAAAAAIPPLLHSDSDEVDIGTMDQYVHMACASHLNRRQRRNILVQRRQRQRQRPNPRGGVRPSTTAIRKGAGATAAATALEHLHHLESTLVKSKKRLRQLLSSSSSSSLSASSSFLASEVSSSSSSLVLSQQHPPQHPAQQQQQQSSAAAAAVLRRMLRTACWRNGWVYWSENGDGCDTSSQRAATTAEDRGGDPRRIALLFDRPPAPPLWSAAQLECAEMNKAGGEHRKKKNASAAWLEVEEKDKRIPVASSLPSLRKKQRRLVPAGSSNKEEEQDDEDDEMESVLFDVDVSSIDDGDDDDVEDDDEDFHDDDDDDSPTSVMMRMPNSKVEEKVRIQGNGQKKHRQPRRGAGSHSSHLFRTGTAQLERRRNRLEQQQLQKRFRRWKDRVRSVAQPLEAVEGSLQDLAVLHAVFAAKLKRGWCRGALALLADRLGAEYRLAEQLLIDLPWSVGPLQRSRTRIAGLWVLLSHGVLELRQLLARRVHGDIGNSNDDNGGSEARSDDDVTTTFGRIALEALCRSVQCPLAGNHGWIATACVRVLVLTRGDRALAAAGGLCCDGIERAHAKKHRDCENNSNSNPGLRARLIWNGSAPIPATHSGWGTGLLSSRTPPFPLPAQIQCLRKPSGRVSVGSSPISRPCFSRRRSTTTCFVIESALQRSARKPTVSAKCKNTSNVLRSAATAATTIRMAQTSPFYHRVA
jgi:hypothetical protein